VSVAPRYVTVTAAAGWCAPSHAGETAYERLAPPPDTNPLEPPSWWTASSGNRYPAAVLEPDFPWPLPVPTVTDRRTWTPSREQRARWAEEDLWLRTQLQLCVPERSRL
jgi:hypothetical protein